MIKKKQNLVRSFLESDNSIVNELGSKRKGLEHKFRNLWSVTGSFIVRTLIRSNN